MPRRSLPSISRRRSARRRFRCPACRSRATTSLAVASHCGCGRAVKSARPARASASGRPMLRGPFDPAAVHQRDVRVAVVVEDPPEPRGVDAAALVVDDDARRVRDAELRHHRLELRRRRQERRRRVGVADRDRRQVDRARARDRRRTAAAACRRPGRSRRRRARRPSRSRRAVQDARRSRRAGQQRKHPQSLPQRRPFPLRVGVRATRLSGVVGAGGRRRPRGARGRARSRSALGRRASPSSTPAIASAAACGRFATASPKASTPKPAAT